MSKLPQVEKNINQSEIEGGLETVFPPTYNTLLAPPLWLSELARRPEATSNLENEGHHLMEIGTDRDPAHSFRIGIIGLDQENQDLIFQIQQETVAFFETHNKAGLAFRMEGSEAVVSGVLNPTAQYPFELCMADMAELAISLETITKEHNTINSSDAKTILAICEAPERQIAAWKLAKYNTFFDLPQAVGLTNLAWALHALEEHSNELPTTSLLWITPKFIERIRESMNQNQVRDDFVTSLDERREFAAPKKKIATSMFVRNIKYRDISRNTRSGVQTTTMREDEEVAVNLWQHGAKMFPTNSFMVKIAGEKWANELLEKGEVSAEIDGLHLTLKIDFSGMSRLVDQGLINPGILIPTILASFSQETDNIYGEGNSLLSIKGDAIQQHTPLIISSEEKILAQLVQQIDSACGEFPAMLENIARQFNIEKLIPELEVGIKAVAIVSKQPEQARFYRGGLASVLSKNSTSFEADAEALAKTGGFTASLVIDPDIGESTIFGVIKRRSRGIIENTQETRLVRLRSGKTVLEHKIDQALNDDETEVGGLLRSELAKEKYRTEKLLFKLRDIDNNTIAAATIVRALKNVLGKHPEFSSQIDRMIRECYNEEAAITLLNCANSRIAHDKEREIEALNSQYIFTNSLST